MHSFFAYLKAPLNVMSVQNRQKKDVEFVS